MRLSPATRVRRSAPRTAWPPRARASLQSPIRRRDGFARRTAHCWSWRRGARQGEVESRLKMHPYAAKMLVRRLRGSFARGSSRRHLRGRRSGVVDPWRLGVPGRRGADARGAASDRRRRRCGLRQRRASQRATGGRVRRYPAARFSRRAARVFLRAPLFDCRAPLRPPCRSATRAGGARPRSSAESPDSTALSSRRKWVLTAPWRRRFSSRSRSDRWMRFRCEAMLAIGRPATIAGVAGVARAPGRRSAA